MADFDPESYVMLAEIGRVEVGKNTLQVAVLRYGDGEPKLKVRKIVVKKDKSVVEQPMKGFSADEADVAGPLLVKGAAKLREIEAAGKKGKP